MLVSMGKFFPLHDSSKYAEHSDMYWEDRSFKVMSVSLENLLPFNLA